MIRFKEYNIKPLTGEDISGVSALASGMSGYSAPGYTIRSTKEVYYRWMYEQNPVGPAISYVAALGSNVVSCFSVAPKKFLVEGEEVVVGKTMDMYTHPDHQGKGLVSKLYELCMRDAHQTGMGMIYVTPSPESYPIFVKKYGYEENFQNYQIAGMLDFSRAAAALTGIEGLSILSGLSSILPGRAGGLFKRWGNYDFRWVNELGPEVDALWERSPKRGVSMVKDLEYLNWRYLKNPDDYEIAYAYEGSRLMGILVLKRTVRKNIQCGEIMDLICGTPDRSCFVSMISFACAYLRSKGCVLVQAWSISGSVLNNLYRKCNFYLKRRHVPVLINSEAAPSFKAGWDLFQGDGNDV